MKNVVQKSVFRVIECKSNDFKDLGMTGKFVADAESASASCKSLWQKELR